jgi:signal peptidase I
MNPTMYDGDQLIMYKFIYNYSKPKRGDIVIIYIPKEKRVNINDKLYIKRVIATEGEKVRVKGRKVYIDNEEVKETFIKIKDYYYEDFDEATVPKNNIFVMGDNRTNSRDSRDIGFIPLTDVKGKALIRIWPFSSFGLLR